jgi:prepilin-type N-terminal cleavage/methylation domain-containing protein
MKKILKHRAEKGFTLLETVVAMAILSFGILTLASIYTQGVKASYQSQIQFIAQEKAQEALETIFTARDTQLLSFAQINNVSQGGVFLDGPQPLLAPGPDGLVGTADDDATNPDSVVVAPGPDNILGNARRHHHQSESLDDTDNSDPARAEYAQPESDHHNH